MIKFILGLILLVSSCSYFIPLIEDSHKKTYRFEFIKKKNYCSKTQFQIITESPLLSKTYQRLIESLPKTLSSFEQFTLLSLLQMYHSPHVASPSASFIFFSRRKKKWQYLTFNQDTVRSGLPFLHGLEFLLKKYRSRYRLQDLAALVDSYLGPPIGLSPQSALFIQKHKKELTKDLSFQHFYQRGDYLLRYQESLKFKTLSSWIQREIHKQKKSPVNPKTIEHLYISSQESSPQNFSLQCNFDINLYERSIFPVSQTLLPSVQFMLKIGDELFLGLLSQNPATKLIPKTPFFDRQNTQTNMALCAFVHRNRPEMILTSSDSRDPGQHLYYFLQYSPQKLQTPAELDKLLSFSRHIFLYNPPRLLYESNRGSKRQLGKLIDLDFPIYHSLRLGKILAVNDFSGQTHLFADDRFAMGMECQ